MGEKIKKVFPKGDSYPLIINFQNNSECDNYNSKISRIMRKPGEKGHVALIQNGKFLYTGKENSNSFAKNLILIKNKTTGKIRLIEVGNVAIKACLPENTSFLSNVDSVQTKEKFGSKKQKRAVEQAKKYKIDVSTVKEQLEATVMKVELNNYNIENASKTNSTSISYTPTADKSATNARDVYKLSSILSPNELSDLEIKADIVLNSQDSENDIELCAYIKKYMSKLYSTESIFRIQQCCALLLADCLIKYLLDDLRTISNKTYQVCKYSSIINKAILDNFSTETERGRGRSISLKDKTMCHIIILLLIGNDCIISNAEELRTIFKASIKKLQQLVRLIGARFGTSAGSETIILKFPLTEPPDIKIKSRKKS